MQGPTICWEKLIPSQVVLPGDSRSKGKVRWVEVSVNEVFLDSQSLPQVPGSRG